MQHPDSPRFIPAAPPGNLFELMLRDLAALLDASRILRQFALDLRPVCHASSELTAALDRLIGVSDAGFPRLHPPLAAAGLPEPLGADPATRALVTGFLARLPLITPGVLAAEITVNLRLLIQHVELEVRLTAESALLLGQKLVSRALLAWAAEWRATGRWVGSLSRHARVRAYIADVEDAGAPVAAAGCPSDFHPALA